MNRTRIHGRRAGRPRALAALALAAVWAGCGGPPEPVPYPDRPDGVTAYTVQPGETLYDLAERFYGDRSRAWDLALVNELAGPDQPAAGDIVYIPVDPGMLEAMAVRRRPAKEPYNRGTALLEWGRDREAARQLARAVEETPEAVTPLYHLAVAELRQGRTDEALEHLEEVVRRRPLDADFRYALGCAYLEEERVDDARRAFEQALRFEPGWPAAMYGIALSAHLKEDRKEAARLWRAYLQAEPSGAWADRARTHLTTLYGEGE